MAVPQDLRWKLEKLTEQRDLISAFCLLSLLSKGSIKIQSQRTTSINILESERKRLGASYKNDLERRQASRLGVGRPKSHVVVDVYRRRRRRRRRQKSLE